MPIAPLSAILCVLIGLTLLILHWLEKHNPKCRLKVWRILLDTAGIFFFMLFVLTYSNEHFRYYRSNDWFAWIGTLGEHPQTRFAVGFSERSFSKIKPDMTTNEVFTILGEPLGKMPWDLWGPSRLGERWDYSESITNIANYHMRTVIFNPEGKVAFIGREYFSEAYESGY